VVEKTPQAGVDTPEDLARVERIFVLKRAIDLGMK